MPAAELPSLLDGGDAAADDDDDDENNHDTSTAGATTAKRVGNAALFGEGSAHKLRHMYEITPTRAQNITMAIAEVGSANECAPSTAASLAGKIMFATASAFARVGRAAIQPLWHRAAGRDATHLLTRPLSTALRFFIALLPVLPPRVH